VLVNDLVLIGSYDTHLYALQQKDGAVRWKLQTNGPVHATAAVQNGVIYLGGCDERFRAVRVADGKVLFELPLGGYTGASPAIAAQRAFVGTFNQDVVALDLQTKRALWRFRDPEREFPYYSSAALLRRGTDTLVVVGGRDKRVHAIDANSGKSAWTFITALSAALEAAKNGKQTEIVALLEKAGAKPAAEFAIDPAQLARYAGTYRNPTGNELTFAIKDGKLTGGQGGQSFTLAATDPTTFRIVGMSGVTVTFVREGAMPEGKVTGLTITQGGQASNYSRVEGK